MSSDKETKGIKAIFILEMIGRPKEHLTDSMNKIIEQMEEEKNVEIISKNIKEPVEMKDNKEFFTTFCEIEVEVKEIANLAILLFKYMPAHVEIVEPELIALTNNGWTDILSELTRRLHGYEEIARVLQHQNMQMKKKLEELTPSNEDNKKLSKNK